MIPLRLADSGSLHAVAVGAHPDDIELGAGGTLLRLASHFKSRLSLDALILTSTPERSKEAHSSLQRFVPEAGSVSLEVLDLRDGYLPAQWQLAKEALSRLASETAADVILAPHRRDAHQDHRTLAELVLTVWRDQLVLGYEIPKFDGDLGTPNTYVPMNAETLEAKWSLLNECFASQRSKEWFDRETISGLARLRGVECRAAYAEAFYVSKAVLDF